KATFRAAREARMATAAMAAMAASVVFARITEVASRDLLNFLPATGRTYLLSSTTSVNHRGPPSLTRAELGTNGLTGWDHACLEMSIFPAFWAPEMPENVLASVQLTTFAVSGVAR